MYNPKDILTEEGYEQYICHLKNIENGLFYIINHADDLHIGIESKDRSLDVLYCMNELIHSKFLLKGDGEKDE